MSYHQPLSLLRSGAAALLLACSTPPAGDGDQSSAADLGASSGGQDLNGGSPGLGDLGGASGVSVLTMPPVNLDPGVETTLCVEVPLGNAAARLVRRVHVALAPGSHHLIVYRSAATTAQPTPRPCTPFAGIQSGTAPLFIAQASDNELTMPDNVGIHLNAQQMIRIEQHFLNATPRPIQGTATVALTTVPEDGKTIVSDLMFWGSININIPPRSTGQAGMFRMVRSGVNVFGMTTHQHQYGTLATVSRATSAQAAGAELYRNTDWAEPPLAQFRPPLTFDGTTGLRLRCEYNNTSNKTLTFGESAATNEMCFFWAYYYPSHGFDVAL